MERPYPQLSTSFTTTVARDDLGLQSVIRALNRTVQVFHDTYASHDMSIPLWSDLSLSGRGVTDHVLLDFSYFANTVGRRLSDLFWDLVDSLERRRLAVSALAARAVIETSAAVVYAEERIIRTLGPDRPAPTDDDLESLVSFLHQLSGGARFDWLSWHSSAESRTAMLDEYEAAQSTKDEPGPDESLRAINVITMIKRLDTSFVVFAKSVGETRRSGAVVRATYAMLSDHCHPACGSYRLYLKPAERHRHSFTSIATDDTMRWFCREMMGYIAPIGNIADRALISIGRAANQLAANTGRKNPRRDPDTRGRIN